MRKAPYWEGLAGGRGGVSLGYRKSKRGAGSWIGKIVVDGNRIEERVGAADDDHGAAGALSYRSAASTVLAWSAQQYAAISARDVGRTRSKGPTVGSVVEAYIQARLTRSQATGANAESRLRRHVLSDRSFAETPLRKLTSEVLDGWRQRVTTATDNGRSKPVTPSSMNRLLNDLRAALNAAAARHRRELPPTILAEIREGTKATSVDSNARKQLLNDRQVNHLIEAAFDVDADFGFLVVVAAATGARHSQFRSLRVGDVQIGSHRIMMPGSRKGRAARQRPAVAVPISAAILQRLSPILAGRDANDILLERWSHRKIAPFKWERDKRRAWGTADETEKSWAAALSAADLPTDLVMYSFRHTSIVRGLRAGLPVRLVAALHDTSSEMIEKHYSVYIVDATEELARRAILQ